MPITFEQVSYSYAPTSKPAEDAWALRDVDLTVEQGCFLAIIGHTGSGKSTLIQHINGLLLPGKGRVTVDGLDTADARDRRKIRSLVGVVFQYPEYQLFGNTVAEDVGFGPRNMGLDADEVDRRIDRALTRVGLDPERVRDRSPFDFSGGQRRRIAFAGVLAMDPRYLVLDEPMAGLDPAGRHEIMGYVEALHEEGMTVCMVSHSMDDVADFAEQVVVLKGGRVFCSGTPEEVFRRSVELREIGLTVPVTTRMAQDLERCGFTFDRTCFTLDQLADQIAVQLGGKALGQTEGVDWYG